MIVAVAVVVLVQQDGLHDHAVDLDHDRALAVVLVNIGEFQIVGAGLGAEGDLGLAFLLLELDDLAA